MIHQHPIFAFILSIFAVGIIIKQCITKAEILKVRLGFSFFLVFILAFILLFYQEILKNETYLLIVDYLLLGINVIIGIIFFTSISASISEISFNKEFMESLDKTKIFILLDKKERIKIISSLLAEELGVEGSLVLKKNFFSIIDECWEIVEFNGVSVSNEDVKKYYQDYKHKAVNHVREKRELVINKKNGDQITLNLMESAMFVGSKYNGRLLVGDKKTLETMLSIEKELVDLDHELESVRLKFISALEITQSNIFFKNLDNNKIWGNDSFVESLKLNDNNITIDDYMSHIHPDDVPYYLSVLSELTVENSTYEAMYRFSVGGSYKFVKEIGKRIFENKKTKEILGFLNVLKASHYEKSNVNELDNIQGADALLARTISLYSAEKTFEIVSFKLDNIPYINEEHGRNVGNMVMSQYIEMIRKNLLSDESDIFRTGGIEFAFIIRDFRLMEKLNKVLAADEKILHLKTQIASINLTLEVHMGLALSTEAKEAKKLILASHKALKFAEKPQVKLNHAYYKDIV